jgi:hypothetical protein
MHGAFLFKHSNGVREEPPSGNKMQRILKRGKSILPKPAGLSSQKAMTIYSAPIHNKKTALLSPKAWGLFI